MDGFASRARKARLVNRTRFMMAMMCDGSEVVMAVRRLDKLV